MRKTTIYLCVLLPWAGGCGSDDSGSSTITIKPGAGAAAQAQAALIGAKAGTTVVFEEGVYMFSEELSLAVSGVTIRGQSDRSKVVLDFSQQAGGGNANGFSARSANDLVLQDLTIRDSAGDAVRVQDSMNVTLRNLDIHWTRGSATQNGAYGIYPVFDQNVLIENCQVKGASDAGIYVGQSNHTMVRGNRVEANVTGIEIENTDDAEVVDNIAIDNVSGILVFNLPNLRSKTGARTKVHKNRIEANNRTPFAIAGSIVSYVPPGTGSILFANDNTEVHDNTFTGNSGPALVIVSCATVELISDNAINCADPDSRYDSFPEGVNVHDNTFTMNGLNPQGFYPIYWVNRDKPFYDIIWDGVVDAAKPNSDHALDLCIKGNAGVSFATIDPTKPGTIASTDLATHNCTHPALAGVSVTW